MDIRRCLNWESGYEMICREERNVAAIFYHALLLEDNLERFLRLVGHESSVDRDEAAVFYEYAYLRDLWFEHRDKSDGRKLILDLLDPPNRSELESTTILDFNRFFGAVPRASSLFIQSPCNWSISRFAGNIPDNDLFLRVCRFKWAFNAKPDIVIQPTPDTAVCVEAKCESVEGRYPSNPREKLEFARRDLPPVRQTDVQAYLMRDLLGLDTRFVFLVLRPTMQSLSHETITWREAFACMDVSQCLPFVREWIRRLD